MRSLPSSATYASWLALFRVLTGLVWLVHGVPKFLEADKFMPPNGAMGGFIQDALTKSVGPFHDFLANVVQPNIGIFAELVRLGEVCVGLSLVLGAVTRLGGLVGVLLSFNYLASKGPINTFSAWSGLDACILLLSAISLVLPTGRAFGVDAFFVRRKPPAGPIPVRAEFVEERPMTGPTAPP